MADTYFVVGGGVPVHVSGNIGGGGSGSGSSAWVDITGKPAGLVSQSAQAAQWSVLSASFAVSASRAVTASYALNAVATWGTLSGIPSGLVSSSMQLPAGIISSSTQAASWTVATASVAVTASYALSGAGGGGTTWGTLTGIPSGLVSSSTQLPAGIISSSTQLPAGTVSSSVQAAAWTVASSSVAVSASLSNAVQYANVLNKPSGIVSSSAQIYTLLDLTTVTGVLSSSAQINALTGVSASWASSSLSASYAPAIAGTVTSSVQASTWTVASASVAVSSSAAIQARSASFVGNQSTVVLTIANYSGSIIQTGYAGNIQIPASMYVNKYRVQSVTSGSIHVDLRQTTQANWTTAAGTSLTGSGAPVSMSNNQKLEDATLTNWTRTLATDDIVNVWVLGVSGSNSFSSATVTLYLQRV